MAMSQLDDTSEGPDSVKYMSGCTVAPERSSHHHPSLHAVPTMSETPETTIATDHDSTPQRGVIFWMVIVATLTVDMVSALDLVSFFTDLSILRS